MKRGLSLFSGLAAGAALGFALALGFLSLSGFSPTGTPRPNAPSTPPVKTAPRSPLAAVPSAGAYQNLAAGEKLACALRLRGLSPEQRDTVLEDCLRRQEPEREQLLALLLTEWAESDPAAAMEWTVAHLEGSAADQCIRDIAQTWAVRDGHGLAEWADAFLRRPEKERKATSDSQLRDALWDTLVPRDPVSFAGFLEMACNQGMVMSGMSYAEYLRTPEAVKSVAARLAGHVAYREDSAELQRHLVFTSSGRHLVGYKAGWNELFESTAVAWHRMNPEECDAWLATFPGNARTAARHFIDIAEAKPAAAVGNAPKETAGPSRPNPAPPPPAAAEAEMQSWSEWWRKEPAAADAFLNTAAWTDRQKFLARAKAYSSAP